MFFDRELALAVFYMTFCLSFCTIISVSLPLFVQFSISILYLEVFFSFFKFSTSHIRNLYFQTRMFHFPNWNFLFLESRLSIFNKLAQSSHFLSYHMLAIITLDLKPLLIINQDFIEEFPCLVHELSVIRYAHGGSTY